MLISDKICKTIRRFSLIVIVLFFIQTGNSQTVQTLVHQVLQRISSLQTNGNKYLSAGIMPTYRSPNGRLDKMKPDNTAFTTGVIVFILNNLRSKLSYEDQLICDSIAQRAYPSFKKFKNSKGRNAYNYWQTDTLNFFPNSGWAKPFVAKKSLPDDMDDTVMLLMALGITDSVANEVHTVMQDYINTKNQTVNNTYKQFKYLKAYSTWYGKKMPIEFDACVMANVLYFNKLHHIAFSAADSACLYFITQIIEKKYHVSDAAYVSPYYATTPLLLYHFARLMALGQPIIELEKYKPQLIAEAKKAYQTTTNLPEKIILQTAMMRWGVANLLPIEIDGNNLFDELENNPFVYFIGDLGTTLKNPYKKIIASTGLLKFNFYCPAYNDVLFLENLLIYQELQPK